MKFAIILISDRSLLFNQLDVANRFIDYHTKQFGYTNPNVQFRLGKIEQLTDDSALETNSFDVVVYVFLFTSTLSSLPYLFRSNCVVNLSPDKGRVLQQVYQMLKVNNLLSLLFEYG
jgi:arsenite methyltransferase